MSKIYEALKQAEQDRNDVQRKALSTMLARFTADRDSLITSIQECQQQLATLTARVEGPSLSTAELTALSQTVAQLESEQQRLAKALGGQDLAAALDRLAIERDHQSAALRRYGEQLVALLARLDGLQASVPATLQAVQEQLAEVRTRQVRHEAHVEAAAQSALSEAGAIRARVDTLSGSASIGADRLAAEQQTLTSAVMALHDEIATLADRLRSVENAEKQQTVTLREQIDELQQRRDESLLVRQAAIDAGLAELKASIARVEGLHSELQAAVVPASPPAEMEAVSATLQQCQADLRALLLRVDDLDSTAAPELEILREQMAQMQEAHEQLQRDQQDKLQEALQRSLAADNRIDLLASDAVRGEELVDIVRRLAVEEQGARETLQATQKRLGEVVSQIEAAQAVVTPQVEALRGRFEALQNVVSQAERGAREAASEALARAQEALHRIDDLAAAGPAQRAQALERLSQVGAAQETLAAAVVQYRDEMAGTTAELARLQQDQARALERQLAETRDAGRAVGTHAQQLAERALAQAGEAAQRVEEMRAVHDAHRGAVDERLDQLVAAREAVEDTTSQLAEHVRALTAHLANPSTLGVVTAEVVQQTIDGLRDAQLKVEQRAHQATTQLHDDLAELSRRLDGLEGGVAARTEQLQTLSTAVAAAEARLHDGLSAHADRVQAAMAQIETVRGDSQAALATVQSKLAGVEVEQRAAGGRARATIEALEAAVVALQQRLTEIAAGQEQGLHRFESGLSALRGDVETVAHDWQGQLGQVARDLHTAWSRQEPALGELRQTMAAIETLHAQTTGEVRAIAEAARGRAADALQRIDDLARRQRISEETLDASRALQASLEPIVRHCEGEIQALAGRAAEHARDSEVRRSELRGVVDDVLRRLSEGESERVASAQHWDETFAALRGEFTVLHSTSTAQARLERGAIEAGLEALAAQLAAAEGARATAMQGWESELATLRHALSNVADEASRGVREVGAELDQRLAQLAAQLAEHERARAAEGEQWAAQLAAAGAAWAARTSEQLEGEIRTRTDDIEARLVALAAQQAHLGAVGAAQAERWQAGLIDLQATLANRLDTAAHAGDQRAQELQQNVAVLAARVADIEQRHAGVEWSAELAQTQARLEGVAAQLDSRVTVSDERWDEVRYVLDGLATRLEEAERVVAAGGPQAAAEAAELQGQPLPLAADLTATPQWLQLQAALSELEQRLAESEERHGEALNQWRAQLDGLHGTVADLAAQSAAVDPSVAAGWHEMRAMLDTLAARLNVVERERPASDERWHATIAELHQEITAQRGALESVITNRPPWQELADEQTRLRSLLESATRAQSTADAALRRTEVLDGAHAASLDVLRRQIAQLGDDATELRATVQAHSQQADAESAMAVVQSHVDALQSGQEAAFAELHRRIESSSAQADALARRFDELSAERQGRDAELTNLLSGLADERDAVNAAIRRQADELGRLLGRLTEHAAEDPATAALQANVVELRSMVEALRQTQQGTDRRVAQIDAALSDGSPLHAGVRAVGEALSEATGRFEREAEAARRQVEGLQGALDVERSERLAAEAEARAGLREVSERMVEAAHAVERALAARPVSPVSPPASASTPSDPIAAGLGRVEMQLAQLLSVPAPATSPATAVVTSPVGRAARWPLLLLAVLGFITAVSGIYLIVRDVDRAPQRVGAGSARVPLAELDDPALGAEFAQGLAALQGGDLEAAERAFRAAVVARPDSVEARNNLAVVLVEQRRLDAAAEQLREALRIQPEYERARVNLGRVERLKGSTSQVREANPATASDATAPPRIAAVAPRVVVEDAAAVRHGSATDNQAVAAPASNAASCTVQAGEQRICCSATDGSGQTCFALAATPARKARAAAKSKPRIHVDDEDLDLLYDLP